MRATVRDVARHPTWLGLWWQDATVRHLRFWRMLLFEKGQGWLRWGTEERTGHDYIADAHAYAPYPYMVAPPLRRFAIYLRQWLVVPRLMWWGTDYDGQRYRYSWEESAPCWPTEMKDADRRQELFGD